MGYNGWANYETWNLHLWLSNDEGSQAMAAELCQGVELHEAAGRLQDWAEEYVQGLGLAPSFASDLLTAALSQVDWREVAAAFQHAEA